MELCEYTGFIYLDYFNFYRDNQDNGTKVFFEHGNKKFRERNTPPANARFLYLAMTQEVVARSAHAWSPGILRTLISHEQNKRIYIHLNRTTTTSPIFFYRKYLCIEIVYGSSNY